MTKKQRLVNHILNQATVITQAAKSIEDSIEVFLDRGYQAAGSDPITQEDIDIFSITLQQLYDVKTFHDNLTLFLDDGTPAEADYRELLNKIRQDK